MTLTLTLDRVEVTLMCICGQGLLTHQITCKSEKLFVDVRTYGRTDGWTQLQIVDLLGHRRGDDLKLLNSNISSTCPYNMVNFGLLAADILSLVSLANFNGFHLLAALLHGTLVVGVSQTLRR